MEDFLTIIFIQVSSYAMIKYNLEYDNTYNKLYVQHN